MPKRKRRLKKKYKYFLLSVSIFLIVLLIVNKNRFLDNSVLNGKKSVESVFPDNVLGTIVHTDLIYEGISRPMTKREIKYIVIHETDNKAPGSDAKNHAKFLKENNESTTSWHYTVDDHEIYHHIPDDEIAYHAGDKDGNKYGIGIELCVNTDGDFEKTFANAAKLVAYLLKSYNLSLESIKMHHDFSGKDCPHSIIENNRFKEFKKLVNYYLSYKTK